MTFTPTTWILNSAPALNATQLNRMEHGIDIAQGDVMVLFGTTAAIPATDAELVGRLYFETDEARRVLRDNGAGWDVVMTRHLLQTGQTTQYGGYLDDGHYEMGIAKDYTVLTAGQYSGTTAIVLNAKTDNHSNNCVQDNITGLMWSRYVSASVGPANDGQLPWTTNVNGEGIFTYCAAANTASLAGYADWRVPNVFELYALVNMEAPSAVPDAVAFPGWTTSFVWSSTTCPNTTTSAMNIYFTQGAIYLHDKVALTRYCPLVRAG